MSRVGIKAVQSILKLATQSNLSMFHNAGNITNESVFPKPSVSDILDMSNSMTCTMSGNVISDIKKCDLVGVTFGSLILSVVYSDFLDENSPDEIWYEYEIYIRPVSFVRFYIDSKKLISMNLTLSDIVTQIFPSYKCCISPDFMGIIDIPVNKLSDIKSLVTVASTLLCGSQKIKDVICISNKIHTIGSDLNTLLFTVGIDGNSITSNDIHDVEKTYGIEAARKLISSLLDIEGGDLIAKFMTRSGTVIPLNKSNVSIYNRGFVSDISYERIRSTITKHLSYDNSIIDPLDSVYAKIWAGSSF